ncbi:putative translation initiation factor eIF2 beta subunit (isoform A) [Mycosarcoma maydis]|uniref:Translation initiation factor eIF2 beta subunit (Isoform A) n=1 Tax=Mycosarcoma maydis TaxID=5270 RepID=A0A0D1C9I0_MYCMD|nr:putative translation initiation factor eIF2 beta subunit (isoform A) [Ustilago maydis 521]KIS70017.1 putative translation initiation factor eIF2 beta subunit (isoform A) [Ustilago maydis 521]|eukprot:XP_011388165.1 putative translation initiation factor eIF2 beta subunit (isoform A) [Ustilago maydis 521]
MSDADTLHNAASSAAPVEQKNDSADLFGGMKKKKKDKKKLDLDLDLDLDEEDNQEDTADAEQSNAAAAEDDELNFGELKKKKKSKKKVALDLDAFEKEIGEADDQADDGAEPTNDAYADVDDEELGENPFAQDEVDDIDAAPKDDSIEAWQGTDRDYTYQELLGRVFKTLRAQNPALSGDKKKFTMVPPQVARDGSKKTVFANVVDICKRMHRQPEHVIQFLFAELGTIGSVDGSQRLVIRGRFQPKQIENVLRRYITEYVICKTCKRPETKLTKENRIFFVTCEKCGSQRSVSAIKSGFQAQTGKRSKTRAAAGA